MSFAVLIDGGFVVRKLGTKNQPVRAEQIVGMVDALQRHPSLLALSLHRAYFYHALPLTETVKKPLQGGDLALGAQPIVSRTQKLFEELRRAPFFSLRLGELAFRGWAVSPKKLDSDVPEVAVNAADLRPHVEQKGVDMRIGMDIAALTLKKHVRTIVLVTGDSDFIPAMKFARREGAQVFLVTLGHRIKEGMYEHSDLVIEAMPASRDGSSGDLVPIQVPGVD